MILRRAGTNFRFLLCFPADLRTRVSLESSLDNLDILFSCSRLRIQTAVAVSRCILSEIRIARRPGMEEFINQSPLVSSANRLRRRRPTLISLRLIPHLSLRNKNETAARGGRTNYRLKLIDLGESSH